MLRIHFSDADLAATRLAAAPDPLWEVATSLHRLQTQNGRWAFAGWHRSARARLRETGLDRAVREVLAPLFPRAAYFPDFLTPAESSQGLDAGLDAIVATPRHRILAEMAVLDRVVGAPSWAPRFLERETREEFVRIIRAYDEAVIAPYGDRMQARFEAERTAHCRRLLDGGVEGMLAGLSPTMRWRRPVLHVDYPEDRDLYLNGRGMVFAPSYFCWKTPVTLADPGLPPVLMYPVVHEARVPSQDDLQEGPAPSLTVLLGRTRAGVLCAVARGATTGEIARAAGVSAPSASRHATALRDAGLITSSRQAAVVLHTLTPAGASLLNAGRNATGG